MVDFHGRPASAGAALAYIEALAPGRPMFVEEVLPPGDTAGLAAVAAKTSVPIATGERLIDRTEFDELFRTRAIDIVQPDICHCGGLLEAKKIAAMAEAAVDRRRAAQSARPDRRRRRAAFRRLDAQPCDPGGDGRRGALVLRRGPGPDPHGRRPLAGAGAPGLGVEVDEAVRGPPPVQAGSPPRHQRGAR